MKAVHYEEIEDRQTQIERHINVENEDAERIAYDWKEEVRIDHKFDVHRDKVIEVMTEVQSMWDGHLVA